MILMKYGVYLTLSHSNIFFLEVEQLSLECSLLRKYLGFYSFNN